MANADLSGIDILASMGETQREALSKFGSVVEVPPGGQIVRQGALSDDLFLVLKGKVGVYTTDQQGGQVHLCTIERGGHFGEIGWLKAKTRTANVRAILPSEVFRLDGDSLEELMRNPDLAAPLLYALSQSLASRLADTNTKVTNLRMAKNFWNG